VTLASLAAKEAGMRPTPLLLLAGLLLGCSDNDSQQAETRREAYRDRQRNLLQADLNTAEKALLDCKVAADERYDNDWTLNSTPRKDGQRWGNAEILHHLEEKQHREKEECQQDYENAVQKARLLHGEER
jgi:hypothetical protein